MFSVSLGIKAGGILYMPALLGAIQYRFGIFKLLSCVVVIFAWQLIIAAPFVLPQYGGKTSLETYI